MIRWEKLGLAVPHDISQYWVKGAVIPRSERGEAVKIKGEYLMYLSEVCGGITHAGQSTDMVNWSFAAQEHLDIGNLNGSLHEVSCAIIGDDGSLVLDFFYRDATNQFAAAQALYDVYSPFTQKALNAGGSLACGGLLKYQGTWLFAQGWDAPRGSREMYFYRAG